MKTPAWYLKADKAIKHFMKRWSVPLLRASFAIIFIWFGVLKPLGLSPAEPLLLKTVQWLPVGKPTDWLSIIGFWEVVIGLCFLFRATTKIAIALLYLQMAGTFMPLFLLPEITFQEGRFYQPSMEGQYIIKNLMIIAGALVVGATTYNERVEA